MNETALQAYLHEHIPLSKAMQVEVVRIASEGVLLAAPLAPNINHRETVFGGSAAAVAILAAWSLLHVRLRESASSARLVIQRQELHYAHPIVGDFTARSFLTEPAAWDRFARMLERKGRGRISVSAVLECGGAEVGRMDGDFVALAASDVSVVPFRAELAPYFRTLNEAWIERLFAIEEADRKVLGDPESSIVRPGGMIYFALRDGTPVGTVAAVRESASRFELAKMGVDPAFQGAGIGRRLGLAAIEFASAAGAQTMFLLTNSRLENAIHLYEQLGFRHRPVPANDYARADVYMELALQDHRAS